MNSAVASAAMRPAKVKQRLRQLTDGWTGAMLGALVYAAWAVAVNWTSGAQMAAQIGAAHWLMSTLLTYYGTAIMRRFFRVSRSSRHGAALAFVGGLVFTYSVLIGVHSAVGTPHIALTLAAGVIPTLLFCGAYALLLLRTASPAQHGV